MKVLSIDIGVRNLCIVEIIIVKEDTICLKNIECTLLDLIGDKSVKKCKVSDLLDELIKQLSIYDPKSYDYILIENQMTGNPKCKNISIVCYTYFRMINKQTLFVSSKLKLGIPGQKLTYIQKKKAAVIECYKLLNDEQINKLELLHRQHDAADAILQCFFWFQKSGLI